MRQPGSEHSASDPQTRFQCVHADCFQRLPRLLSESPKDIIADQRCSQVTRPRRLLDNFGKKLTNSRLIVVAWRSLRELQMKSRLPVGLSFVGACLLILALAGPAHARNGHGWRHRWWHRSHSHGHHHAPELDPNLLGKGLVLLGGSILVLLDRSRRR